MAIPGPVRTLLEAADVVVANSSSARVSIARLEGIVDPRGVPAVLRDGVAAAIERAASATAHPLSAKEVEAALRAAWGRSPSKHLDAFDPEPLAVRPHAQVHRGALDDRPLAIKVARPGIAGLMRSDLTLLATLAGPIGSAFPGADPAAMIREVRERVLDELDLDFEGEAQRSAARRMRHLDGVRVARVEAGLTTEGVLVAEHIEAPTLEARAPADPARVARTLVAVFAGAPRGMGGVLANARASDVAVAADGEVVLLGAGAFRAVPRERSDAALDALEALRADDEDAFVAAVGPGLGVLSEEPARAAFALVRELYANELEGPWKLDAAALARLGERALDRLDELYAIATAATPGPADLWPARMAGQLAALLARLEATEDWTALALAAGRAGW